MWITFKTILHHTAKTVKKIFVQLEASAHESLLNFLDIVYKDVA